MKMYLNEKNMFWENHYSKQRTHYLTTQSRNSEPIKNSSTNVGKTYKV